MKKLLCVLLVIGLFGCSSETAIYESNESNESSNITKRVEKVVDNKEELLVYTEEVAAVFDLMSQNIESFGELNKMAAETPLMVFQDPWVTTMALSLTLIQNDINSIYDLSPPEEMKDVNDLLLLVADNWQFVVDNYPTAIDNIDADLMNECTSRVDQASSYIRQATALVEQKRGELF